MKGLAAMAAVVIQLYDPERAYGELKGGGQAAALSGSVLVILAVGLLPLLLQGRPAGELTGLPVLILIERMILACAGGLGVYALSYALGERNPLWPAIASCVLSMGAFMIFIAFLTLVSNILSLPPAFTWSPAEAVPEMPETRLALFLLLFLSRIDLASAATLYLWGTGLAKLWEKERSFGVRMTCTVYLFGLLMITLPVFLAAPGSEGAS